MKKKVKIILTLINIAILSGCTNHYRNKSIAIKEKIDFSQVAFIEPASGLTTNELKIIQKSFPLVPAYLTVSPVPYHASDDKARFQNLANALHGNKKYIWAAVGGYGSARLLDDLTSLPKPQIPKILIGYSDVTFLHLLFNQWGWKTIHGAMPIDLYLRKNLNYDNFVLIEKVLSQQQGTLSYKNIKPLNSNANKMEKIEGTLIGGNLTLLANSLGTSWQLDGDNKIIFIEDVGVNGYVTDRNLTHLRHAKVFEKAKAVLFGSFIGGDDKNKYALTRFANDISIPVFYSNDFGHGDNNYPLPFGFNTYILKDTSSTSFNLKIDFDFKI